MTDTKQNPSDRSKPFDNELFRQQALTANLSDLGHHCGIALAHSLRWTRTQSLPWVCCLFYREQPRSGAFLSGAYRLALIATALGAQYGFAMVIMNAQPAHMVLAMANFVLLHAVVLGRRWALALTAVRCSDRLIRGEGTLAYFRARRARSETRELSKYTTLMSLITTAISTGYLIVTTAATRSAEVGGTCCKQRVELAKAALKCAMTALNSCRSLGRRLPRQRT